MHNRRMIWKGILISIISLSLAGCWCSKDKELLEEGQVKQKWGNTLFQLGIIPVFPPRGDIQVGDMFFYDKDYNLENYHELFSKKVSEMSKEEKKEFRKVAMKTRGYRLDVGESLDEEYKTFIAPPKTNPSYNTILGIPAIASIKKASDELAEKIKANEEKIDEYNKNLKAYNKKVKEAKRKKEKAENDVKVLESQLNDENYIPVGDDIPEAYARWEQSSGNLNSLNDDLESAREADNQEEIKKLEKKIKIAEKENKKNENDWIKYKRIALETSKIEARRLDSELVNIKAENETDDFIASKEAKDAAEKALPNLKKKKEENDEFYTKVASAGVRYLYPEPEYSDSSVFSGRKFEEIWSNGNITESMKNRLNKLKTVAFPEFSSISFSQSDLSLLVPIEAMQLGLNVSSDSVDSVSLKIPSAESYGLSTHRFINHIYKRDSFDHIKDDIKNVIAYDYFNETSTSLSNIKFLQKTYQKFISSTKKENSKKCVICADNIIKNLNLGTLNDEEKNNIEKIKEIMGFKINEMSEKDKPLKYVDPNNLYFKIYDELNEEYYGVKSKNEFSKNNKNSDNIYIHVISEIFLARAIDISLFSSDSFGLRTQLTDPFSSIVYNESEENDEPIGVIDQETFDLSTVVSDSSPQNVLGHLKSRIGTTQRIPGGTIQLTNISQNSIGLRRVYETPVAIGFRGFILKVNKKTGAVLKQVEIGQNKS